MNVPKTVHGNPVIFWTEIPTPLFPRGYTGDGNLERTKGFLIAKQGEEEDELVYFVSCVGESGRIMAGDMCYTVESAMAFPKEEFDVPNLEWKSLTRQRR